MGCVVEGLGGGAPDTLPDKTTKPPLHKVNVAIHKGLWKACRSSCMSVGSPSKGKGLSKKLEHIP